MYRINLFLRIDSLNLILLVIASCPSPSLGENILNINSELKNNNLSNINNSINSRLLFHFGNENLQTTGCYDPDEVHLKTIELIEKRGYPSESHIVQTEDGYILTLHRIPNPTRAPILLFHGMFQSSRDFLMNCGNKPLPFQLWNAGYDVWLANVRGNPYSRSHSTFNADKDVEYWNFSVDEVVKYDAPAMIDFILRVTRMSKINWVGYSLGSAVVMGLGSVRPSYNEKLNLVVLLGTTAYVGNTKSPLMRLLAPLAKAQDILMTSLNHGETLPSFLFPIIQKLLPIMCSFEAKADSVGLCSFFLFIVAGFDPQQANPSILPLMLGGTPGSLGIKMLSQWYQWINCGKFSYYDYGKNVNMHKYGAHTPPNYDLSKLSSKVANFWSQNDWLSPPDDVRRTVSELPNVVQNTRVTLDSWNHLDFLYGKDADYYVYKHIIIALERFR